MPVDTEPVTKYTEGLPYLEASTLYSILRVYAGGDLGERLMTAVRQVDSLGTSILDGYLGVDDEARHSRDIKDWRKALQAHIEHLASRYVGRDRMAIALGCFRDFIVLPNPEDRWESLQECRRQLLDLYNVVAPLPFSL